MIALSLGRCKRFLTVPSCDFRVSIATGPGTLQVQPRPQCPESDGRPSKWHPSLWGHERPLRRARVCGRMWQTRKLRETFPRASAPSIYGQLNARHRRSIRL